MNLRVAGTTLQQIETTGDSLENAARSSDESCDPDSKVTTKRDWQSLKQSAEIAVTEDGMQIDESDEQFWNADCPMYESVESGSNVIVARDSHPLKQNG
jgi:hypothetical protein